jgi:hypothetical protein
VYCEHGFSEKPRFHGSNYLLIEILRSGLHASIVVLGQ